MIPNFKMPRKILLPNEKRQLNMYRTIYNSNDYIKCLPSSSGTNSTTHFPPTWLSMSTSIVRLGPLTSARRDPVKQQYNYSYISNYF